jgi:Carboxypeptidase regulatory-like domain
MKRHGVCAIAALWAVLLSAGCDSRSAVQPSSSRAAPLLPGFFLSGRVVDPAYRPISGSRVEVMNGSRAGTVEITDDAGDFSFEGMFTDVVTIAASKDGYASETRIFPPPNVPLSTLVEGGMWQAQFYLAPLGPSADIAGVYTLSLTADRACTNLPADVRTRSYTATVVFNARPGFFQATLSGAQFLSIDPCPPGRPVDTCTYNKVGIGLAGDYASIGIGVIERLASGGFLWFEGGASGSFGPTGIAAPLNGSLMSCPVEPTLIDQGSWACPADAGAQCESPTHQLTMTRR